MSAIRELVEPMDRNEVSVLVVDDIAPIVEEMLTLLELKDIPAVSAYTLDEAIRALEDFRNISVVVCDVRLGKESGLDLMDMASQQLADRQLNYVFVTGDVMGMDKFREEQKASVMTKPIRPHELVDRIRELLETREA